MARPNPNPNLISEPRRRDDAICADISGEIDLQNSPQLREALLAMVSKYQPKRLVLNLAKVPYLDSSAIAVLVEALQKMRRAGGRVMLTALQPRVRGLIEIARLDSLFVVVANEDEALSK
jgi:anti-sigma B factor antagonist